MSRNVAGWYQDPSNPSLNRYWDGKVWTDATKKRETSPPFLGWALVLFVFGAIAFAAMSRPDNEQPPKQVVTQTQEETPQAYVVPEQPVIIEEPLPADAEW